jgi:hypothetical protein
MAKWGFAHHPTHAQKLKALETLLDYKVEHAPPMYSSVSWRQQIYLGFKHKLQLQRSTDATLRDIHALVRRANDWFRAARLPSDYLLVEQRDIETLLDLHSPVAATTTPSLHAPPVAQRDIRDFLICEHI